MVLSALELAKNGGGYCGSQTNQSQYNALMISNGYFTYDFLSMAYFGLLDLDMTIHHLTTMAAFTSTLFYGIGSNFWLYGLIIGEISNP
jgi:hypothetical protein